MGAMKVNMNVMFLRYMDEQLFFPVIHTGGYFDSYNFPGTNKYRLPSYELQEDEKLEDVPVKLMKGLFNLDISNDDISKNLKLISTSVDKNTDGELCLNVNYLYYIDFKYHYGCIGFFEDRDFDTKLGKAIWVRICRFPEDSEFYDPELMYLGWGLDFGLDKPKPYLKPFPHNGNGQFLLDAEKFLKNDIKKDLTLLRVMPEKATLSNHRNLMGTYNPKLRTMNSSDFLRKYPGRFRKEEEQVKTATRKAHVYTHVPLDEL